MRDLLRLKICFLPLLLSVLACTGCQGGNFKKAETPQGSAAEGGSSDDGRLGNVKGNTEVAAKGAYQCGEAFDAKKLINAKPMLSTQLAVTAYEQSKQPKGIAINEAGFGFAAVYPLGTADDEVRRVTLNRCIAVGNGQPCKIVALGNSFCPNGEEKLTSMTAPTTLLELPFSPKNDDEAIRWLKSGAAAYMATNLFKAAAMSIDGQIWTYVDYIENTFDPLPNDLEAERLALEKCELSAAMIPCTTFARGNTIVFNPKSLNWTPKIDYSKKTLSKPSLITADTGYDYFYVAQVFPNRDVNAFQGVIFINYLGESYIDVSAGAEAATKQDCEEYLSKASSCFKYAQGPMIVFGPKDLKAFKNPDIHCKVMPRISCEAHKAIGCAEPGTYLIAEGDKIKEMACN